MFNGGIGDTVRISVSIDGAAYEVLTTALLVTNGHYHWIWEVRPGASIVTLRHKLEVLDSNTGVVLDTDLTTQSSHQTEPSDVSRVT